MENKYILGTGINALIYAYYNPDFKCIGQEVGGVLKHNLLSNTILLHNNDNNKKLLNNLGIEIIEKTHTIKYVKDNILLNNIDLEDKKKFILKKVQNINHDIKDVKLSTNDYYIDILDVDFVDLISRLCVALEGRIIIDNIIRITNNEIITEKTKYKYDYIVSTLNARTFWNLYYNKDNQVILLSKPITFVLCDSIPKILDNANFNLVYFIDDDIEYTRINKKGDTYLYEFTGEYSKEDLIQYLPENTKIFDYYIQKDGIIFSNENNIPPMNVEFIGRFATFKHSDKIQDTIKTATFRYDFRNIWNRQKAFSSKMIDFNSLDSIEEKEKLLQLFILHLVEEVGELLRESNYKMHKPRHELDLDKIKEETMDIFKYVLNIYLVFDVDVKEFIDLFNKKSKICEDRLK